MDEPKDTGIAFSASKASSYSIIVPTSEKPRSPGPALYGPSNITLVKKASPQYSISPRIKTGMHRNWPASNCYDRSNYKPGKTAPSFSFGMRTSNRSSPLIIPDYVVNGR